MMLSKVESGKDNGSDLGNGQLLRDIEEISRALHPHETPTSNAISPSGRRSKSAGKTRFSQSNSNFVNKDLLHNSKKSSIWNWKPLKALAHIRNRRFTCWFFLHVHTIEGLPSNFNDTSLCVQWKRKDEVLQTRAARVSQGVAEFEETLMHRCSIYGSRSGPHGSAKYEPKLFLLYALVVGAPGFDLGKHWIDLTKLLPLTLEELAEEKSTGKWTTSFKLTGKAKGGMLNVSFGFLVPGDNWSESQRSMNIPKLLKEIKLSTRDHAAGNDWDRGRDSSMLRRVGSVPSNSNPGSHTPSRSLDIKYRNEVMPNRGSVLARSITYLYQKLDEAKMGSSQDFDLLGEHVELLQPKPSDFSKLLAENIENDNLNNEFVVMEHDIELSTMEQSKLEGAAQSSGDCEIETIDVNDIFKDDETAVDGEMGRDSIDEVYGDCKEQFVMEGGRYERNGVCTKELMTEEFESVKYNLSVAELGDYDFSLDLNEFFDQENYTENRSSYDGRKMVKSLSLDDLTESVANDFLKMVAVEQIPLEVGTDNEPDSPRELLLRQFEEEALASSGFFLNLVGEEEPVEFSDGADVGQSLRSKRNVKLIENLETEALMKEWGINETIFHNSPRTSSGGFGSPIYLPPEDPSELPPLGEGLGPNFQTKNGGFLRSMNPSLFRKAKNGVRLIMQVSAPVVLPLAMGSSIMEILQHWASVGHEKMSLHVNKLMPMEDISGKMMRQVAWQVASGLEAPERHLQQESEHMHDSISMKKETKESPLDSICDEIDSDYVSLEDLAPLAMDKIEALSIEGLRIQSGMSEEEAPSSIRPQSIGKTSAFCGSLILEGGSGLQLSEIEENVDDVDELISLSITLGEWMRLDAGDFRDEEDISERTFKIIAAHAAENMDFVTGILNRGGECDKPTGRSCGMLGNNFTVALRVQLRDPVRDYETVGAPMLALVQVERVFIDLKPKLYRDVSESSGNDEEDDLFEDVLYGINCEDKHEKSPWFKITEVHLAGFNTETGKMQQWGMTAQEQSGFRWLLASGMATIIKHLHLKSNAIVKSCSQGMHELQLGDTVWSISSHVHGLRAKWKELATLNLHIRNPDVIFQT